jgi:LPS export ABC transporter protein LptC
MKRKPLNRKNILGIPVGLLLAGILVSCVNDLDDIKKVTFDPESPTEVSKNLEVFITDSGYPKVKIFAKLAEKYTLPEEITKLKDGLRVDFYDEEGEIVSTLTSLYGEIRDGGEKMLARDSVELYNYAKKQRLKTEELHWNQNDSLIYSEKNVSVSSPEGVIYGTGIRTKQDFSKYVFTKPRGTFNMGKKEE